MLSPIEESVIKRLGYSTENYFNKDTALLKTLQDIVDYGCIAGVRGFFYYKENTQFFLDNKKLIIEELFELSDGCGRRIVDIFKHLLEKDIFKVCADIEFEGDYAVKNTLAWVIIEQVSYRLLEQD